MIRYTYQETEDSPVISGEKTVEHVHFKPWAKGELPQGTDCLDILLNIVEQDGARFLRNQHLTRTNDDMSEKLLVMSGKDSGRSGSLIALINAVTVLQETKFIE